MTIRYSRQFVKQLKKLPQAQRTKFYERQRLFEQDPYHSMLNNHTLKGRYRSYNSINITGDLRALYFEQDGQIYIFELIGTHSQLYGK